MTNRLQIYMIFYIIRAQDAKKMIFFYTLLYIFLSRNRARGLLVNMLRRKRDFKTKKDQTVKSSPTLPPCCFNGGGNAKKVYLCKRYKFYFKMKLLDSKTALITGASRGIGKQIALVFAQHGAQVAFTDLKEDANSQAVLTLLRESSPKAHFYPSDASSFEDAQKLAKQITEDFGRIDILVNNAGITRDNLLLRMQEEDFDTVMKVNLKSVFNLTKAVMPVMLGQRNGSIINISSIVGLQGNAGQANYAASKAGMLGFTKSVARELGSRNIRCNAIAPGFIETEMTHVLSEEVRNQWIQTIPLRRAGTGKDVAQTAVYLACDLSSYITGQVISCDGGMHT
jgi:3-oxoacyl-[acyl-carrier protein] reductase